MKSLFLLVILGVLAMAIDCCAAPTEVKLAANGKALFNVVVASDATVPEQNAAKELVSYLKQVTGADFSIYTLGKEPAWTPRILVGQSDTAKKLTNIKWQSLKFDGIVIKFAGKDIVLAGDRPRGTVYAVYSFLEDYVGCKWWTAKASFIPRKANLSVKQIDKTHIPPFMYRETYYAPVIRQNMDFSVKLKLNGSHHPVPQDFGGAYNLLGFVHTADKFMPASKYFDAHPEWFSLVNGKRIGGQAGGQLCLTNEDMKAEFVKNMLEEIAKDPSAGMIAVDQNDNQNYCQCEKCKAVAKEEGGQSGVLIRFVNSVADEIAKKYPDFLVETLAYQYTRHAPKLARPRDNVIVRLCSIECDFASPLDSKSNASFYKDLQDWKKMAKRLYVWDYVVNFGNLLLPHPNWNVLAPNIRIFADNHVVGLFEQGDGFNKDSSFGNMKIWVMSHLMWDKDLDSHKLMKEFATGYYGPAGQYMVQYLDLLSKAAEKNKTYLSCFIGNGMPYMNQSVMDKANDLFDKAEASVKNNPALLERVKLERLALDHAWIIQPMLNRTKAGKARGIDMKTLCENYINLAQSSGNDFIGEAYKIPDTTYASLRSNAAIPPLPASKRIPAAPATAKGLKKTDWVDIQEDKMNLYQPGVYTDVIYDMDASDARAVRMPGSTNEWATSVWFRDIKQPASKKIDVYATIKVKKKAASGPAFTFGIYDTVNREYPATQEIKLEDIKSDGYVDYKLGTFSPKDGWYVYIAPPGNADLVDYVQVDRLFFIKSK